RSKRDWSSDVCSSDLLHPEAPPGPVAEVADPVAGDAREVFHHGFAAADEAVDHGRLADVGPPDDRDRRQRLILLGLDAEGGEGVLEVLPVVLVVAEVAGFGPGDGLG